MSKFSDYRAIAKTLKAVKAATEAVKDDVIEVGETTKGRKFHSPIVVTPEAKEWCGDKTTKVNSAFGAARNKVADFIATEESEEQEIDNTYLWMEVPCDQCGDVHSPTGKYDHAYR